MKADQRPVERQALCLRRGCCSWNTTELFVIVVKHVVSILNDLSETRCQFLRHVHYDFPRNCIPGTWCRIPPQHEPLFCLNKKRNIGSVARINCWDGCRTGAAFLCPSTKNIVGRRKSWKSADFGGQTLGLRRKSWKSADFGMTSTRSEAKIMESWTKCQPNIQIPHFFFLVQSSFSFCNVWL